MRPPPDDDNPIDTPKDSGPGLVDRTLELQRLLNEAEFDDDTRGGVNIYLNRSGRPHMTPTKEKSLYPGVPRKYKWVVGIVIAIATAATAAIQILKSTP